MSVRILIGDVRQRLAEIPDESVHCAVTSPPYWGLRDYGVAGQIGLETSPQEYIETLVAVFHQVRRVLRANGTLWLNLGDSYAGSGRGGNPTAESSTLEGGQETQQASMVKRTRRSDEIGGSARDAAVTNTGRRATRGSQLPAGFHDAARQHGIIGRARVPAPLGLKQKDLVGIPWRVALALQADGWWLRQDIIWAKPNPMPESVTDRCTKSHEYLFLLAKSERYYFDQAAIAETVANSTVERLAQPNLERQAGSDRVPGKTNGPMKAKPPRFGGQKYFDSGAKEHRTKSSNEYSTADGGRRNRRSVWTISTTPFSDAHFATFPVALVAPCILAGSPKGGVILDPFFGAGTTGLVAERLGRDCIGVELNPAYAEMARRRIAKDGGMLADVEVAA